MSLLKAPWERDSSSEFTSRFSSVDPKIIARLVLLAIVAVGTCVVQRGTKREVEICVQGKGFKDVPVYEYDENDTLRRVGTEKLNLVYTDQGTLKNDSSIFNGKWGTEDMQGEFQEGEKYRVEVTGFDLPGDMSFPNIVSIEEHLGSCKVK